jgi:hypothetical protein
MARQTTIAVIAASVANIYAPTQNEETELLHFVNESDNAVTIEVFVGATGAAAAGTAAFSKRSIAARGDYSWPFKIKLTTARFITARASTASVITAFITTNQVAA